MAEQIWALKILSGPHIGAEITLEAGSWSLGRHEECDLVLTDDTLNDKHLEFDISEQGVVVHNLAQDKGIFLNGAQQDNEFALPPHTVVMAGNLYFAMGLTGQPWPELALPGIEQQKKTPPPPPPQPQSESQSPSQASDIDESQIPIVDDEVIDEEDLDLDEDIEEDKSTELSSRIAALKALFRFDIPHIKPLVKRFRWYLVGAGLGVFLSLFFGVFIWLWQQTDPVQAALDNITPIQKAEQIRAQIGLHDVKLKKLPDKSVLLTGYVMDNNQKEAILSALRQEQIPFNPQLIAMNEMRATANAVLQMNGYENMSIELDTTPGSLVLSGYVATNKGVSKIRDLLIQEVHGLISLVDQVEYQTTRIKALRTMLKEKGLGQRIRLMDQPGKVILKGRLNDATQGYYLKEVVQDFRGKYGKRPDLIIDVTLPSTDLATMQPVLKIKSISMGRIPYVILENGEKYLRGAKLRNGYILEGINLDYLTLRLGQERIKYYIGGKNGGQ